MSQIQSQSHGSQSIEYDSTEFRQKGLKIKVLNSGGFFPFYVSR